MAAPVTALLLLGAVLCAAPVLADGVEGAGRASGAVLAWGAGARAAGMGEAFAAVAGDTGSVAWNPAGLGPRAETGALASHQRLPGGARANTAAVALPGTNGVAGAGFTLLDYGPFDARSELGDPGGPVDLVDLAAVGAWGFRLPPGAGVNGWGGFAVEAVDEAAARPWVAVSAGVLLPVGEGGMVGAALQHLGFRSGRARPPTTLRLAGRVEASPGLHLAGETGWGVAERLGFLAVGAEAAGGDPRVAGRLGYQWISSYRGLGGLTGLTLGAGVRLGWLGVDYAWQPFGDFGDGHRLSAGFRSD